MPRLLLPLLLLWLLALPLVVDPAAAQDDMPPLPPEQLTYAATDKVYLSLVDPEFDRLLILDFNLGVEEQDRARLMARMPIVRGIIQSELQGLAPSSAATSDGAMTIRDTVRTALERQVTDIRIHDVLIRQLILY